jgi:hypothetical protein
MMSLMTMTMMSIGKNDSLYIDQYRHPVGLCRDTIINNHPYREQSVKNLIESIITMLKNVVKLFILSLTIDFLNVKYLTLS